MQDAIKQALRALREGTDEAQSSAPPIQDGGANGVTTSSDNDVKMEDAARAEQRSAKEEVWENKYLELVQFKAVNEHPNPTKKKTSPDYKLAW